MTGDVKRAQPRGSGVGPAGQARTRLARRAVVDASRTLFLERGYHATTIEAISDLSDVPVPSLYRLFTSKLGILKALLDTSIAGDDEPFALQARADVAGLLTETDPRKLLAEFAGVATAIHQRTNEVYRVLVSAAESDPAAGGLLADVQRQRDRGQSQLARALVRGGSLRAGLRERDAADRIHALLSPELYRLLVLDRHWTPKRYQGWLAITLAQQLT